MKDYMLQDPVITRAERTGYGYAFDEIQPMYCDDCGDLVDDYDLDAYIGFGTCICGRCWKQFHETEED